MNPVEYYTNFMIFKSMVLERDMLESKDLFLAKTVPDSFLRKRAGEHSSELIASLRSDKVGERFLNIFELFAKKTKKNYGKIKQLIPTNCSI